MKRLYGKEMRNQTGFTLIEAMITTAVVAVALLGLLAANLQMRLASMAAYERSVAMRHAHEVIERMRNAAETSLSNVTSTFSNAGTVSSSNYLTSSSTELLKSEAVVVSYVSTSADPLDTTVTVSWSERGVRTVSLPVRTLITRRT